MSLVIVNVFGGLGNQMFQYAVGRALSLRNDLQLRLDARQFSWYQLRQYELGHFRLDAPFAKRMELLRFHAYLHHSGLQGKVRSLLTKVLGGGRSYEERSHRFDPAVLDIRTDTYLLGYFQSELYFRDYADTIRADFQLKSPLDEQDREVLEQIESSQAISLHVRRGDYVSNPHTNAVHGVCSLDYYERACQWMMERVSDPHFFLFSDDPEWVKANLRFLPKVTVVDHNSGPKAYADMYLMSRCRHHIVANSSFSWWGAWLNPDPGKVVIAPERWFQDPQLDDTDLVPEGWLRF